MKTSTTNDHLQWWLSFLLCIGLFVSVGTLIYVKMFMNGLFPFPRYFSLIPFLLFLFFVAGARTNLLGSITSAAAVRRLFLYWSIWSIGLGIVLLIGSVAGASMWLLIIFGLGLAGFAISDIFRFH